jgi:hypothetical protein
VSEVEKMSEDEEEEEVSEDEGDDYKPKSDEESASGSESESSGTEEGSDEEEDAKRQINVLKRKLKAQKDKKAKKSRPEKKKVVVSKKSRRAVKNDQPKPIQPVADVAISSTTSAVVQSQQPPLQVAVVQPSTSGEQEKHFDVKSLVETDENGSESGSDGVKKGKKKEAPVFNDKNLDYNLFNNDPENVVAKKIKISNTMLVTCKMIDGVAGGASGLAYDYAALSFVRKIQNQKAFEFNVPLALSPNIIEALKLIIKDNPKFFQKHMNQNQNLKE